MTAAAQIKEYLDSLTEAKAAEMRALHEAIRKAVPKAALHYFDGKDENGKTVSNPTIGYGKRTITYANGKTAESFKVGISANTSGISAYILGLEDKTYLARTYGKTIGKAQLTGYCIKFKSLKDIVLPVLLEAVKEALQA